MIKLYHENITMIKISEGLGKMEAKQLSLALYDI